MLNTLIYQEDPEMVPVFSPSANVLLVKFPCSVALHLYLYPEVMQGMKIMKYADNQTE